MDITILIKKAASSVAILYSTVFLISAAFGQVPTETCLSADEYVTSTPVPPQSGIAMMHYEKILYKMPLDADFVVLGDSQAQGWPPDLLKSISPSSVIFNYGVAGDRTQTVLWQMRTAKVRQLKPKLVLLVLGTNNLGADDQPCAIAKAMGEVVAVINQTWNTPKILLIEIAPRGLNFSYRDDDRLETHLEIRRSLAKFHNVTFINIDQAIAACAKTDGCNTLRPDLLHEPPRVFRRLFGLSYAAMGMASSWA